MRAILVYNNNSGGTGQVSPETLMEALQGAGYQPVYEATSSEADLDRVLADAGGLVVCAGGDGTVRAVATRLIGLQVGLAVIPLGTANNIARTLGISGSPEELVARLDEPVKRGFDVGRVRSPWGLDYFLEACGYGLYADGLAAYDPEKGKSVLRSFAAMAQIIPGYTAHTPAVLVDGKDFSNHYLLFEVLNTSAFGPRVKLAPQADPGDGQLDVVAIREDNRDSLLAYVSGLLAEELVDLPSVEVRRGKCIEIGWPGNFHFHVDGEVRPPEHHRPQNQEPANGLLIAPDPEETPAYQPGMGGLVTVEILPQALEFWLPRPPEPEPENSPAEDEENPGDDLLAYLPPR